MGAWRRLRPRRSAPASPWRSWWRWRSCRWSCWASAGSSGAGARRGRGRAPGAGDRHRQGDRAGGIASAAGGARNAQRFIGDARLVVLVQGEVVHWSDPVGDLEARDRGDRGDVEVILERPDPGAAVSDWVSRRCHRAAWRRRRPGLGAVERRRRAACAGR